jgi:hypothetical protein
LILQQERTEASLTVPALANRAGDFRQQDPLYNCALRGATNDPFPKRHSTGVVSIGMVKAIALMPHPAQSFHWQLWDDRLCPSWKPVRHQYGENGILSKFGGYLQVPCASPFATHTDTLKLFVDGKVIASKDVSYDVMHR